MAHVVTFENVTPTARYDATPWTEARIEEAATSDGVYAEIETIDLSTLPGGVDADPANPAVRDFTTELGTAADLWYRIIFVDATADESAPTDPLQNSQFGAPYASVDELARILKLNRGGAPSAVQTIAMQRVLSMAAGEIDAEIDRAATADALSGWQLAMVAQVNLERAAELWEQQEIHFGIVGIGSEFGATHIARNTWDKHAYTLAPLKGQFGLA